MTRRAKPPASPNESGISNFSCPINKAMIQIRSVLHVSIVDLCAADAYFVMATPQALNIEIEQMMPIDYKIRTLVSPIYWKASFESSR